MKIQKIHIVDFKCIEDLTLDFDTIRGFWEIEGVVGSGKTTIGEALLFGLFGSVRDKSNTSLIRWSKKHCHIEIWCESKHKQLYIKRDLNQYGQSPLTVFVDGQRIVFTNKRDAQQQLQNEYYDVSRLMVETLCIISFKGFKSLSSLNTRDTNEFLDQAFGFSTITNYANSCVEMRRKDNENLSKINTNSIAIERQIKGYKSWQERDEHITQDSVSDAQNSLKQAKEEHDRIESEYKSNKQLFDEQYTNLKSEQAVVKSKGSAIKKSIDLISKGVCPTCGAPLDQSHLLEHQQEREELLKRYQELDKLLSDIQKKTKEHTDGYDKLIKPLNDKIMRITTDIRHYQDQLKQQKQFDIEITHLQEELKDVMSERDMLTKSITEWDELQQVLLKDVKDGILLSLIPSINENIEQYMSELHQPYIVKFDKSFSCSIQVTDIDEPIPISSLSTGQLKTVDMIIILSILRVLLSNVSFNIIFLDELLTNMHDELRDMMCKLLRENIRDDQRIFIISHVPLNENYLDGRIHVSYKNRTAEYEIGYL